MKDGWHPKGRDGGKESWRGDFKGINQVVSLQIQEDLVSATTKHRSRRGGWARNPIPTRKMKGNMSPVL
jgi:hypothetical protein